MSSATILTPWILWMLTITRVEYRLIPETWPEVVLKDWILPWEGNHILVELPIHGPTKIGDLSPADEIRSLVADGLQPVLAHPERYLYLEMDDYKALRDAFQHNAERNHAGNDDVAFDAEGLEDGCLGLRH